MERPALLRAGWAISLVGRAVAEDEGRTEAEFERADAVVRSLDRSYFAHLGFVRALHFIEEATLAYFVRRIRNPTLIVTAAWKNCLARAVRRQMPTLARDSATRWAGVLDDFMGLIAEPKTWNMHFSLMCRLIGVVHRQMLTNHADRNAARGHRLVQLSRLAEARGLSQTVRLTVSSLEVLRRRPGL